MTKDWTDYQLRECHQYEMHTAVFVSPDNETAATEGQVTSSYQIVQIMGLIQEIIGIIIMIFIKHKL